MLKKLPAYSLDKIAYSNLIPTHNKLRSPSSLAYFNSFFKRGIIPERETPGLLIQTEDNRIYIHDAHHYIYSAYYHGIQLSMLDLKIKKYTYSQLDDINFDEGWITPYNPRYYVRRHIIPEFKSYIMKLYNISEYEAITAIEQNRYLYTERRKINTIGELC